jgi:MSHA biogenesis protein MshN
MSLINQVLQDLEERGARPAQGPQMHGEIRPAAVTRPARRRTAVLWLLVLSVMLAISMLVWSGRGGVDDLVATVGAQLGGSGSADRLPVVTAGMPAERIASTPVDVQDQVNAALMVPVFQLSGELSVLPRTQGMASLQLEPKRSKPDQSKSVQTEPRQPNSPRSRPQSESVQSDLAQSDLAQPKMTNSEQPVVMPVAAPARAKSTVSAPGKSSGPDRAARKKQAKNSPSATETAVTPSRPAATEQAVVAKAEEARPSIAKSNFNDDLEEVVIASNVSGPPIERQARQLPASERAEVAFREGIAKLRKGEIAQAESRFREAISIDSRHATSRQALIGLLIDSGRLAQAESVLEESLAGNPRQSGQAMLLARLQVERGDLEGALQTLQRFGVYAASDAGYLSFMAAILQRAKRNEEAVAQYRKALSLSPGNAVWLMGMGISLRALGEYRQARDAFDSAAATRTLTPQLQAFVEQQQRELERRVN